MFENKRVLSLEFLQCINLHTAHNDQLYGSSPYLGHSLQTAVILQVGILLYRAKGSYGATSMGEKSCTCECIMFHYWFLHIYEGPSSARDGDHVNSQISRQL